MLGAWQMRRQYSERCEIMHINDVTNNRMGECAVRGCCREDGGYRRRSEQPEYVKCGCGEPLVESSMGLRGYPLASVYSPLQDWVEIYDLDTGFKRGTIFKQLDFPFMGDSGCVARGDRRTGGGCCGR